VGQETVTTYRYVRVSIVAVVTLLFTALVVQIAADDWEIEPSISAYYYTPVRSVLVGSLVAAAFLLVAVRGRPGFEEALLNLGGMLLPVVAFIPTPIEPWCPGDGTCVPPEFISGVEVSLSALLLLGAPGVGFALWTLLARAPHSRRAPSGYVGAMVIWAVVAVWFGPTADWAPRASLLDFGHYVAAVGVFAIMVVVALINARRTDRSARIGSRAVPYTAVYVVVAVAMALTLVGALIAWWFATPNEGALIFWVEAALLAAFSLFWAVQTAEFWNLGLPEEACQPA
jgi:hypothetical protein